jgi:hypothetical protein
MHLVRVLAPASCEPAKALIFATCPPRGIAGEIGAGVLSRRPPLPRPAHLSGDRRHQDVAGCRRAEARHQTPAPAASAARAVASCSAGSFRRPSVSRLRASLARALPAHLSPPPSGIPGVRRLTPASSSLQIFPALQWVVPITKANRKHGRLRPLARISAAIRANVALPVSAERRPPDPSSPPAPPVQPSCALAVCFGAGSPSSPQLPAAARARSDGPSRCRCRLPLRWRVCRPP